METIKCENKSDFFNEIKNIEPFCDNIYIELIQENNVLATFCIKCNDVVIRLKTLANGLCCSEDIIKRQTGEEVPIERIIKWYKSNL